MARTDFDVIVTDLVMPGMDGARLPETESERNSARPGSLASPGPVAADPADRPEAGAAGQRGPGSTAGRDRRRDDQEDSGSSEPTDAAPATLLVDVWGGQVLEADAGCQALLGREASVLAGHLLGELFHSEGERPFADLGRLLGSPGWIVCELAVRRPDGRCLEVEASARPWPGADGVAWVALREITREKNLERQLGRLARVATPDHLVSDVPASLTELFAVIRGRTELVLRGLGPDHPLGPDLGLIRRAAEGGAAVARRMAALGRSEQGHVPPLVDWPPPAFS